MEEVAWYDLVGEHVGRTCAVHCRGRIARDEVQYSEDTEEDCGAVVGIVRFLDVVAKVEAYRYRIERRGAVGNSLDITAVTW